MTRHSMRFHIIRGTLIGIAGALALGLAAMTLMSPAASAQSATCLTHDKLAKILGERFAERRVAGGLAAGGEITEGGGMRFAPDRSDEERAQAVVNILKASAGEASMMARCTGKTNLQNLEPEDLRSLTLATAEATGIGLAGTH